MIRWGYWGQSGWFREDFGSYNHVRGFPGVPLRLLAEVLSTLCWCAFVADTMVITRPIYKYAYMPLHTRMHTHARTRTHAHRSSPTHTHMSFCHMWPTWNVFASFSEVKEYGASKRSLCLLLYKGTNRKSENKVMLSMIYILLLLSWYCYLFIYFSSFTLCFWDNVFLFFFIHKNGFTNAQVCTHLIFPFLDFLDFFF